MNEEPKNHHEGCGVHIASRRGGDEHYVAKRGCLMLLEDEHYQQ